MPHKAKERGTKVATAQIYLQTLLVVSSSDYNMGSTLKCEFKKKKV